MNCHILDVNPNRSGIKLLKSLRLRHIMSLVQIAQPVQAVGWIAEFLRHLQFHGEVREAHVAVLSVDLRFLQALE